MVRNCRNFFIVLLEGSQANPDVAQKADGDEDGDGKQGDKARLEHGEIHEDEFHLSLIHI